MQAAGFIGARSTNGGFNSKSTPLYELKDFEVKPTTTLAEMKTAVDTANATHTWVIFMFHEVDHSGLDYSISTELLKQFMQYLKSSNSAVITMRDGLLLNRGAAAVPSVAPATDVTPSGDVPASATSPSVPAGGKFNSMQVSPALE